MTEAAVAIIDGDGGVIRDEQAIRPLYSIAKTFIAELVNHHGLELTAPISDWIDFDWVPRAEDITLGHLLTHTSGLRDYGALPLYADAVAAGTEPWTDEEFAAQTLHLPLLFEPGKRFAYSNPGYWLLVQILEQALGTSFDRLVTDTGERLGLTDTRVAHGQFADDLPHYPAEWIWHGVIISTPLDTARFMSSPGISRLKGELTAVADAPPPWRDAHYGLGIMVEPGRMYGHNGNGPGYSAACFHFERSAHTICVLAKSAQEDRAFDILMQLAQTLPD